jgi:DNA-binding transcriptional regulator YiaG
MAARRTARVGIGTQYNARYAGGAEPLSGGAHDSVRPLPGRIPHASLHSFPFGPRHRPTRVSLADASRAKELFAAFGRTIVSKASPLTGPEVRFLRKRLGKKAIEFAPMVSLTPEYLSALENNPDPVDPGRDKLVRLIYRELSGDKQLKKVFEKGQDLERWITSIHKSCVGENIFATHLRNNMED